MKWLKPLSPNTGVLFNSPMENLLPLPGDDPPEPRAGCTLVGTLQWNSSITLSVTSPSSTWAKLGGKLRREETNEGLYQQEVKSRPYTHC